MSNIKQKKSPKRLRKGMAYVEFLAKENEIYELLEKGHTMKHAHEILIDGNIISMSYQSFFRYVTKKEKKKKQVALNKKEILVPNHEQEQQSKPQEALIAEARFNNLAKKLQKENNSLDLVSVNKDEDFFKNDKEN